MVRLEHAATLDGLKREAQRLTDLAGLRDDEAAVLDFPALLAFWQSDLGARVRAQAPWVRRELAFTARFTAAELATLTGETLAPDLAEEFVVVQGAVDLAVLGPEEIWIVDFKTDGLAPGADALAAKARHYAPQLQLYALALSRIYRRPVSAAWLYFLNHHTAIKVPLGRA